MSSCGARTFRGRVAATRKRPGLGLPGEEVERALQGAARVDDEHAASSRGGRGHLSRGALIPRPSAKRRARKVRGLP